MAQIEIDRISKRFGRVLAVDDLSVTISDGEFMVFVGPSGCGKTTTLRMVAGLERASEGEIRIDGARVNERAPKDRDLAMVFQNYALYSHFDVRSNLAYPLRARKVGTEETRQRVVRVAELLGISDVLDRKPRQLSGGQRQRVALGRAIIREPKAFLMDEPLSNLDAALRLQMRKELIELGRRLNSTVMYVTHDQIEAMTMGDRMAVMLDGRVQQLDTPERVYAEPANRYVAGFIGTPPMNFVTASVVAGTGQVQLRGDGFSALGPPALAERDGSTVTVGVRPEDWELTTPDHGFPADVRIVETLGSESLVYVDAGSDQLWLLLPTRDKTRSGEHLHLRALADRMHFFDVGTGTRLQLDPVGQPSA
ncbi:MAG: ABC transporter ATP-binding protein [Egibacteraceae bacterium]